MGRINNPLDFELPLVELELELDRVKEELLAAGPDGDSSKEAECSKLEKQIERVRGEVYGKLTSYQRVQLSRHFDRPFTLDYIENSVEDFVEFHGDRLFRDDPAIVGGTGKIGGRKVMIVGHQRGRTTSDRLLRNFGMAQPEGYRKALRLCRLAEKFGLPVVTLIDTQGAYPGLEAEERGQAEAIARNIRDLSSLTVPIVNVVIGEGGSGGALALGVADVILMMENACYSVISPEGCASILWGVSQGEEAQENAQNAAQALRVTADELLKLGVIDEIVPEPLGGAHRDHPEAAKLLFDVIGSHLDRLSEVQESELLENRYQKFRSIGPFTGGD